MKRMIYCPGPDRWVTLGQYVAAVKRAKASPDALFPCSFAGWWSCTGAEIVREFFRGVQDRINQAMPYMQRGKLTPHGVHGGRDIGAVGEV